MKADVALGRGIFLGYKNAAFLGLFLIVTQFGTGTPATNLVEHKGDETSVM